MEEITVKARKAIDTLWKECLAHARGWGLKRKGDNVFEGSNIILIDKDEVVVLAINKREGNIIAVHEFKRTNKTELGTRVKNLLWHNMVPRTYDDG